MIKKDDIFLATEGGKAVIVHYYPQASACFTGRGKNFKIREDDRNPSCTVFEKEGVWFIQDKGGSDTKAYTAIQLVQREEHLTFAQAIEWIAAKFAPHLLGEKTVSTRPQPKMEEVKAQLPVWKGDAQKMEQVKQHATEFSYQKHIDAYLKLYKELLG